MLDAMNVRQQFFSFHRKIPVRLSFFPLICMNVCVLVCVCMCAQKCVGETKKPENTSGGVNMEMGCLPFTNF